jgi:hypothetical protein
VRAVHDDAQAAQRLAGGQRGEQVVQVALGRVGGLADPAEAGRGDALGAAGAVRACCGAGGGQAGLDLVLDGVGQLDAAAGEELDPVVGGGSGKMNRERRPAPCSAR